ncbi:MAG: adenosylcobinamide-GDP ribazoletransferase [Anaerolineae bacterium]|nr:adenosylcobinamide-GDP ribazoletransferase [Anaerolineae bacterium]
MIQDLRAALAFLTIVPVGYPEGRKPGYAYGWFPLVGLLIGLVLVLVGVAVVPVSAEVRALLILLAWVVLTGGLHLDGLADSCDGLLATTTPEKRLDIMKDPRAGSWAVVGVVLLLLGKWVLLRESAPVALLIAPVAGRWMLTAAAWGYPYARSTGLGAWFKDGLGRPQMALATLLAGGVLVAAVWLDPRVLLALPLTLALLIGLGRWMAGRLGGGLTGDCYGALCEVTEFVCLLGMVLWQV